MGTWRVLLAWSVSLSLWIELGASFNPWMRDSSGGQVVRLVMLSCSTGDTIASSGVGMMRGVVGGYYNQGPIRLHMGRNGDEKAII
jgi:hypothetical protein